MIGLPQCSAAFCVCGVITFVLALGNRVLVGNFGEVLLHMPARVRPDPSRASDATTLVCQTKAELAAIEFCLEEQGIGSFGVVLRHLK